MNSKSHRVSRQTSRKASPISTRRFQPNIDLEPSVLDGNLDSYLQKILNESPLTKIPTTASSRHRIITSHAIRAQSNLSSRLPEITAKKVTYSPRKAKSTLQNYLDDKVSQMTLPNGNSSIVSRVPERRMLEATLSPTFQTP
jgi:hypothetical protein